MRRSDEWFAEYGARASKWKTGTQTTAAIVDTAAPAKSKFGNVKTDGYASKREYKRAQQLHAEQACGLISDLQEQVPFLLIPKQDGERKCEYVADFVYVRDGVRVVEDCKGFRTDIYRLKRKLLQFVHGIRVVES
jgi:hypothetical protein